jgi:hypothetical protein
VAAGAGRIAMPDACSLLSAADVVALVGVEMPGQPIVDPSADPEAANAASVCTWSDFALSPKMAGLQIYAPSRLSEGVAIDPIKTLSQVSQEQRAIDIGTDGKLLDDLGLISGGGGLGKTVTFTVGEFSVALGVVGAEVDAEALTSIAARVASDL